MQVPGMDEGGPTLQETLSSLLVSPSPLIQGPRGRHLGTDMEGWQMIG